MASLTIYISSYASLHPTQWPFKYFKNLHQTSGILNLDAKIVAQDDSKEDVQVTGAIQWAATAPIITSKQKQAWENYTNTMVGSHGIYSWDEKTQTKILETGDNDGPFVPVWQLLNPLPGKKDNDKNSMINFNLVSISQFQHAYKMASQQQEAVVSEPIDMSSKLATMFGLDSTSNEQGGPWCMLVNPIFGDELSSTITNVPPMEEEQQQQVTQALSVVVEGVEQDQAEQSQPTTTSTTNRRYHHPVAGYGKRPGNDQRQRKLAHRDGPHTVVGVVVGIIPYRTVLEDIVAKEIRGVQCVLRPDPKSNNCNNENGIYTFMVNGKDAVFMGPGDKHDTTNDFHEHVFAMDPLLDFHRLHRLDHNHSISSLLTNHPNDQYCPYQFNVYPTDTYYVVFQSNTPRLFAGFLVGVFVFVVSVFNIFGCIAKRREVLAHKAVNRSDAVVKMFFPEQVRDQLYQQHDQDAAEDTAKNDVEDQKNTFLNTGMGKDKSIWGLNTSTHSGDTGMSYEKSSVGDAKSLAGSSLHSFGGSIRSGRSGLSRSSGVSSRSLGAGLAINPFEDKPIATLFPDCTVLFAGKILTR